MNAVEHLRSIREVWLQRAVRSLAPGSGLKDDFFGQLDQFYSALENAVEMNSPEILDYILLKWAASRTQTNLEGKPESLSQFINQLFLLFFTTSYDHLDESQQNTFLVSLSRIFGYAFVKISEFELNVREQQSNREIIRLRQTLERMERSKTAFISISAHELRTPLTLIEGYTVMLSEITRQENPQSPELTLVAGITNGIQRLNSIINDMIDVSLIDNKVLTLNLQPTWLRHILNCLKDELLPSINDRKQNLFISDIPESEIMFFADTERLTQVFRNVLLNAIKFTPDGGRIEIDGRKLPGFLEVIIRDNGIGINPEDQLMVFEKFSQKGDISRHSSSKTQYKGGGPGLGLHISKGIIEAHGGAIWVESSGCDEKTCPGSAFHIMVPTQHKPAGKLMDKTYISLDKTGQQA